MDKRALQAYAIWAKDNLETQIEVSLKSLGINSDTDIKNARVVGEYTVIEGDPNSYPAKLNGQREMIIRLVKTNGYKNVIEEFAYTWFNRIVALRFMEVHGFMPHGFRVLSSADGSFEPEIIRNLNYVAGDLKLDLNLAARLQSQGKIEELYRYVLFRQCTALSDILPMLFKDDSDYLELLLPKALLKGDTVITKLLEVDEDTFKADVEVIGWLYQFYISVKKAQVYKDAKVITKDELPAVTQLFTPDWIVRYMAENSVGRLWLESYPASPLKTSMKYYVEDATQEAEVQRQVNAIKYKNVNPEDIKVIEPCCGSGHVLVYLFDLLYKMYEEKGYTAREIPKLILSKNLFGLEIDKRAAQLSAFALVMKARSYNNRFFTPAYYTEPNVFEIHDSHLLYNLGYSQRLAELKLLSEAEYKALCDLVELYRYGKTIGSLLVMPKIDAALVDAAIAKIEKNAVVTIFNSTFMNDGIRLLKTLNKQYKVMSAKYDVMITNPPYIGISGMELPVKEYAIKHYPRSKTDMFAMFMETGFVKPNGFTAMINMHSWMFLSSYEQLRKSIIDNSMIVNMIHLGTRAFEEIGGEVVQTTSFVLRNSRISSNGVYFRLVDSSDKEQDFLAANTNGGGTLRS